MSTRDACLFYFPILNDKHMSNCLGGFVFTHHFVPPQIKPCEKPPIRRIEYQSSSIIYMTFPNRSYIGGKLFRHDLGMTFTRPCNYPKLLLPNQKTMSSRLTGRPFPPPVMSVGHEFLQLQGESYYVKRFPGIVLSANKLEMIPFLTEISFGMGCSIYRFFAT